MIESSLNAFEDFLRAYLERRQRVLPEVSRQGSARLFQSISYSLFSGGKRFRPQICLATAQMLDISSQRVMPLAAAIEFIHTYSLIHDDLPCMDDDDIRRGQPTNHRAFGEAEALLAGDGLLTEAFAILSESYSDIPEVGLALVKLVSAAAGTIGMVAGQVIDMQMQGQKQKENDSSIDPQRTEQKNAEAILQMLGLKTGALIRLCVEGVAVIGRKDAKERVALRAFGENLGLAFQLADDLLDYDPKVVELSGLPAVLGAKETRTKLNVVSEEAIDILKPYGLRAEFLRTLVEKNLNRKI